MAYSVPTRWTHGDIPTAALMQPYSDSLEYIHDRQGDTLINPPSYGLAGSGTYQYMVHRYRWLAYDDNGVIADPTGVNADVTLSDPGSTDYYDLDTISWMAPGTIYEIQDLDWCMEVEQVTLTSV